jgi:hypothetical protein
MSFASISGKPVEATFYGGILTSDSGVMLLPEAEARIGILCRMVAALTDHRHQSYVRHPMMDLDKQLPGRLIPGNVRCSGARGRSGGDFRLFGRA